MLDADLALPRDGVTAPVLVAISLEVEVIVFAIVLPGVTVNRVAKTAAKPPTSTPRQPRLRHHWVLFPLLIILPVPLAKPTRTTAKFIVNVAISKPSLRG